MGSDMETMSFCLEKDQRIFLIDSYNHDFQVSQVNKI